jgi:hypothetical protein
MSRSWAARSLRFRLRDLGYVKNLAVKEDIQAIVGGNDAALCRGLPCEIGVPAGEPTATRWFAAAAPLGEPLILPPPACSLSAVASRDTEEVGHDFTRA